MPGEIDERFYAQKAAHRSRIVLTSGGNEPVMDTGQSGHSVFGYFFLKTLSEYDKPYLIPTQIFTEVGPLVGNNAPQTPQWGSLREAMDEGGEMVLLNRQYVASCLLSFSSNKACAVYLNGVFIGNTPIAEYQVKPGAHSYRLASAEFGTEKSGSLNLGSGERKSIYETFKAPAPQAPGFLSVATRPWVQIFIDGQGMGYSPKIEMSLSSGKHVVRLVNSEEGIDKTFTIEIEPDQHVKIGPDVQAIHK